MKQWIKYLIIIAVIIAAGGIFYKQVYIPKITFQTIKPTVGELNVSIRGIGNVSALNIYSITAQTGGKITKILADSGTWVKKGDLLVVMDGVDLPQQLDAARANLLKTQYEVKALENELKSQKAQKELLLVTYTRYKRLQEKGFATKSEYDKAKADLQSIDASIMASYSQIDSAKATVLVAQKNIDALEVKINRLEVYAPVDGYVVSKDAEVAQDVLPSTPILKIVDPKTLWVETKVDERISSQIQLGQTAWITLRSQPNKKYIGRVQRINAMSDPVTLEREIDVTFQTIPKPFYINAQAEVDIIVKTYKDVVKIPTSVIAQKNGKLGVWRVESAHISFLPIKKIAQNNNEVAVSNIEPNMDILVLAPNKKPLHNGMKIYQ